jgi:hypothetical protein
MNNELGGIWKLLQPSYNKVLISEYLPGGSEEHRKNLIRIANTETKFLLKTKHERNSYIISSLLSDKTSNINGISVYMIGAATMEIDFMILCFAFYMTTKR